MRFGIAIILTSVIFSAGCSSMLTSGALHGARGDIDDRQYTSALNNLTDANFSGLTEEQAVEVTFLRAKALYGLDRQAEAEAVLAFLIEKHPNSKYPPQARALINKWSKHKLK